MRGACDEAIPYNYQNMKPGYIYIVSNKKDGTIYTGVTSNIQRRIDEHKAGKIKGFSKKYNLDKLVYLEKIADMNQAILREKQLKGGNRKKKVELIELQNPDWKDLSFSIEI